MEWNGGMDWTGTVEWNGMECGKRLSIKAHARTVPYVEVLGLWCCIIYRIVSKEGDGLRQQGIGALFCPGHELTAGIYSYFTPLGNTAIKCWGVKYKLDRAEISDSTIHQPCTLL